MCNLRDSVTLAVTVGPYTLFLSQCLSMKYLLIAQTRRASILRNFLKNHFVELFFTNINSNFFMGPVYKLGYYPFPKMCNHWTVQEIRQTQSQLTTFWKQIHSKRTVFKKQTACVIFLLCSSDYIFKSLGCCFLNFFFFLKAENLKKVLEKDD